MIHAKFQDHRILVLGKIFKVLTIYGHGGHLGHMTVYINLLSHFQRRIHMKFGIDWPTGFGEEDV